MAEAKLADHLLVVNLAANNFVYGGTTFNNVFEVAENQHMVRLFVFVLHICCEIHAGIGVETVVSTRDWVELFGQRLDNALEPASMRLWIPLTKAQLHLFLTAITTAFSGCDTVVDERYAKRARIEVKPEPRPLHQQPVTSFSELQKLVHIYQGGRVTEICSTDTGSTEDVAEDGMDEGLFVEPPQTCATSSGSRSFLSDILDAARQFESAHFEEFTRTHDVWAEQRRLESYVTHDARGQQMFSPSAKILDGDLMRWLECGSPGSMISQGSDLFRFCFPHMTPSVEEIQQKLMQVSNAIGLFPDLTQKTNVSQLVDFDKASGPGDPALYAPISRDSTDLNPDNVAESATSAPQRILNEAYDCIYGLHAKNTARLQHARQAGHEAVTTVISTVVRNQNVLWRVKGGVQGVPNTYFKLVRESDQLRALLRRGAQKDPKLGKDVHLAAKIVWTPVRPNSGFTPLAAKMTRLCVLIRNSLRLLRQQQGIFMFLWLRSFGLTLNRYAPSFCALLCGAPGGGKSQVACVTLTDTVPACFCRMSDGSSAKAITIDNGKFERDLQISVSDEAPTTSSDTGSDAASDERTKLSQSLYVNGSISYYTKEKDAKGKWFLNEQRVIARGMYVFCTNNPHQVATAIRSRSCVVDIVNTSSDKRALSATSAVATANNPVVKQKYASVKLALKHQCAQQFGYTASHATGVIPDACTLLFVVFEAMLAADPIFANSLPARRGIDLLRLSEAIMIYDLTSTWATISHHFNDDPIVEAIFYRCHNYVRAEHIIVAYSTLQQTTSVTQQLIEVMKVLKEMVMSDDDNLPVCDNDYYALSSKNYAAVITYLKHRLPLLGEGLCSKAVQTAQAGFTRGQVHMKIATLPSDGREHVFVYSQWINTVRTQAEEQLLRMLHECSKNPSLVTPSYDHEVTRLVFRSAIRKKLTAPDSGELTKMLANLSEKQLKMGVQFLCNTFVHNTDTGEDEPVLELPAMVTSARYVANDPEKYPDGVESVHRPNQLKMRREEIMPVVVLASAVDTIEAGQSTTVAPIDKLFLRFLAVSGSHYTTPTPYSGTRGPSVFAGISQQSEFKPGHHIQCDPTEEVAVTVKNTLSASFGQDDDLWLGLNDTEEEDVCPIDSMQDRLFPRGKHTITLTHNTNAECQIAEAVRKSACVDPDLYATFQKLIS